MTGDRGTAGHDDPPPGGYDWRRWIEDGDWSDWRSWLRRVASVDWAAGPWPGAPWEQAPRAGGVFLTMRAWEEAGPGDAIAGHLAQAWPAFRRWWHEGANTRPDVAQARTRLEQHMPELVPAWQQLTAMLPGDPDAGAALALWNPPPFLTGCSQAAVLPVATNHQEQVEWAPYAAAIRSVERRQHLEGLLAAGSDAEAVVAACLRPPLYATRFHEGFGTLYTAEYRPADGRARYHWPGVTWKHSLDKLGQDSIRIGLGTA